MKLWKHLYFLLFFTFVIDTKNLVAAEKYKLEKLTEINVEKPAFLFNYIDSEDQLHDLFISSFGPFRTGSISQLGNIDEQLSKDAGYSVTNLVTNLKWPNEITKVPEDIFGENSFGVADGFLLPGKGTGSITIFNKKTGIIAKLTKDKPGFFYHRVIWHDMNGDGLLDIVTARAKKPLIGKAQGELIWLEQPSGNKIITWKEHLIVKGPDVHFRVKDLDGDGIVEILSAEFFHKRFSITTKIDGVWKRRILDDKLGSPFDLEIVDLNNDGKVDVLITNHEGDQSAGVFGYEIPHNLADPWIRHTLFSGFVTRQKGMRQASPGEAMAVHPEINNTNMKPLILVSGDGSQNAHILTPVSEDPDNWSYEEASFLNAGCTVGKMAADDIDNDGMLEVFVPAYDRNKVHVFDFIK